MDLELNDRAYLITGGTDGLGLALARTLVGEGARVAVCGRDAERLSHAQAQLGDGALCYQADVTKASELDTFIDATLEKFGRLDGAVNNAGRSAGTPVATSSRPNFSNVASIKVSSSLALVTSAW